MFKQKRVRKLGGKYFLVAGKAPCALHCGCLTSTAAPKKRRISEEGMRRIISATKKRRALARAAKKAR